MFNQVVSPKRVTISSTPKERQKAARMLALWPQVKASKLLATLSYQLDPQDYTDLLERYRKESL